MAKLVLSFRMVKITVRMHEGLRASIQLCSRMNTELFSVSCGSVRDRMYRLRTKGSDSLMEKAILRLVNVAPRRSSWESIEWDHACASVPLRTLD